MIEAFLQEKNDSHFLAEKFSNKKPNLGHISKQSKPVSRAGRRRI